MNIFTVIIITLAAGLQWYEHIWIALPLVLVIVGGLIGGACGGGAYFANLSIFKSKLPPAAKYLITLGITIATVVAYVLIAAVVYTLFQSSQSVR